MKPDISEMPIPRKYATWKLGCARPNLENSLQVTSYMKMQEIEQRKLKYEAEMEKIRLRHEEEEKLLAVPRNPNLRPPS